MVIRKDFSYYLAIMVHLLEFMCLLIREDFVRYNAVSEENYNRAGLLMAGIICT